MGRPLKRQANMLRKRNRRIILKAARGYMLKDLRRLFRLSKGRLSKIISNAPNYDYYL